MGFKDNAKSVAAKLRLDSHHAIERFGLTVGVLGVAGVLLFAGATTTTITNRTAQMDSTVLYTPTFTTSKTQQSGEVTGIYTNTDQTRTLVMLAFKDAAMMSAKADNYQAFITGSNANLATETPKTQLSGEIVVFGDTGHLGVVIDSDRPFEQQILNLTIRANSELVYTPADTREIREDLADDNTFVNYDQWQVFFNPGASGAEVTTALDANAFDPGDFYAQTVVAPEELEIRSIMDAQLGQMRADLALIDEYTTNIATTETIDGARLVPPEVPVQIDGDRIIGEPGAGKKIDPENTDSPVDVSDSTLELDTDWVSPRGFDFDWRSGSAKEGWLDEIVPADTTYGAFLAEKSAVGKNGDDEIKVDDLIWTITGGGYPDGSLLDTYQNDKTMTPLLQLRNNLAQAYQTYYKNKLDYQVDSYTDLIDLEVELRNVRTSASINSTDKALIVY